MTTATPAELKAEQLIASLKAKLPMSIEHDIIEAEGLRSFIALRQAWIDARMKPLVIKEKA